METKKILTKAQSSGVALGAFNAGNLELVKAVAAAAQSKNSSVILEVSSGEVQHFGMENFLAVVDNLRKKTGLPILTNLDHGPGLEECQAAIEAGFNLVHFDGSGLPLEENVKITKTLTEMAHPRGVLVEAEIDKIIGESIAHPKQEPGSFQAQGHYTDPVQATDFIRETGADLLAVFVGNLHGTYAGSEGLDLERLKLLANLPCFLSLHGGSGVREDDIRRAIKDGLVVKINVNTELRVAFRETLENVLKGSDEVAVYKIMLPVMAAVQRVVEEKIDLFGAGPTEMAAPKEAAAFVQEEKAAAGQPDRNLQKIETNEDRSEKLVKKLI